MNVAVARVNATKIQIVRQRIKHMKSSYEVSYSSVLQRNNVAEFITCILYPTATLNQQTIQPEYFPTNTVLNTGYLTHIKTPTCFGTQVPSAGNYYNKGV
jgi:hypothetical protein